MPSSVILTGVTNLLGVDDLAVPFRRTAETLRGADAVVSNLECSLDTPAESREMARDDPSGNARF